MYSSSNTDGSDYWLVYHGYFELILESLTKNSIAANIIVFGIILGDFILIMVFCLSSLESP